MIHGDQLAVFAVLFAIVAAIGYLASRWHRADLGVLEEWGLAGRRFGTVINWFLQGGDLYTAYTFIAVPALVFGKGALGLFALPYVIMVYPFLYVFGPKLWQVGRRRGHITSSDYVVDRFDSRLLGLLMAITGIVALVPYIALQMFGIEVVLAQIGVPVTVALVVAFLIVASFTYLSGLRGPALMAIAKDVLIWAAVLAAVIVIPIKLGGYGTLLAKVPPQKLILQHNLFVPYVSLAFGSAMALYLYPHAITAVLSCKDRHVVKRNAALQPAYAFMLGLIALLGYMAVAAGVQATKPFGANAAVPELIARMFPGPAAGFIFGAIAIGALVPASVMSIAGANLFSRNIYREYFRGAASPREEAWVSKVVSVLMSLGALVFILLAPAQYAINFQLAGGVWILQTFPAVFLSLYVRWLDRWAVAAGWVVGIGLGTYWLAQEGFNSSLTTYFFGTMPNAMYIALAAFLANVIVVVGGSLIARALGSRAPSRLSDGDFAPAAERAAHAGSR